LSVYESSQEQVRLLESRLQQKENEIEQLKKKYSTKSKYEISKSDK
jgi:hypothetical protein